MYPSTSIERAWPPTRSSRSYVCHALSPSSCSVCAAVSPASPAPRITSSFMVNVALLVERNRPYGRLSSSPTRSPSLIGSVMRCPERRPRQPDVRCATVAANHTIRGTIGISILGYAATSACSARDASAGGKHDGSRGQRRTGTHGDERCQQRRGQGAHSAPRRRARSAVARRSCRARRRTCERRWRRRSPRTRRMMGDVRGRGARARRCWGSSRPQAFEHGAMRGEIRVCEDVIRLLPVAMVPGSGELIQ